MTHPIYLQRCIHLAKKGGNRVFPNPQVGAVIVYQDRIIGEGYHAMYGGPHAEVAAVQAVKDKELLSQATIFVSLEPCNHYGKTPPCTELILKHKIPRVIVGCMDPNPRVGGQGIERLRKAGVKVELAEDPKPFELLNTPFFTNQREKRPYIILKWAQSADGFIAAKDAHGQSKSTPITGKEVKAWVHKIRARHHAIMVGRNTAAIDNPRLNTRNYYGDSPIRLIMDRKCKLPQTLNLFTDGGKTILLNELKDEEKGNISYLQLENWSNLQELIKELYQKAGICSILVEGGTNLLQQFIDQGVYDEVHRLESPKLLGKGLAAPKLPDDFIFSAERVLEGDKLFSLGLI